MGGAVGIKASTEYKEIDALVTDSSFANFPEMVTSYYGNMGPIKYVLSILARCLGRVVLRADFIQNSPEYVIKNINAPILIIHSEEDDFVPFSHSLRLFNNSAEPKELWGVKGSHTELKEGLTETYQEKVTSFFKEHLLVSD